MSTHCVKDCPPEEVYEYELAFAVEHLPEVPPIEVLRLLRSAAATQGLSVHKIGKQLQRIHGHGAIPPVTELESAAGLWSIIRNAIKASNSL